MKLTLRIVAATVLLTIAVIGLTALVTPAEARGPCRCPQIYAPVECDHGKVFANQCLADCRNAKNCVPVGAI